MSFGTLTHLASVPTGDMSHCLGRQSWETPIGAVAESSLEVLEAWPLDRKRMEKGEDLQTGIQIQLFDVHNDEKNKNNWK